MPVAVGIFEILLKFSVRKCPIFFYNKIKLSINNGAPLISTFYSQIQFLNFLHKNHKLNKINKTNIIIRF